MIGDYVGEVHGCTRVWTCPSAHPGHLAKPCSRLPPLVLRIGPCPSSSGSTSAQLYTLRNPEFNRFAVRAAVVGLALLLPEFAAQGVALAQVFGGLGVGVPGIEHVGDAEVQGQAAG